MNRLVKKFGPHIFFVDDELEIRKAAKKTLEQTGAIVKCFASETQCLRRMLSH